MLTAILSPTKAENKHASFFEKMLQFKTLRPFYVDVMDGSGQVLVAVLPYSADKLIKMPKKKRVRLWQRIIKLFLKSGVECLYLTQELLKLPDAGMFGEYFILPDGQKVFSAMIGETLCMTARRQGRDLTVSEVGVWQSCFDDLGYSFLSAIADSLKYVTLFCTEPLSAAAYAEKIYQQTGLSARISHLLTEMNRCDFVILIDELPYTIVNENTAVIDASQRYGQYCINTVYLTVPPAFAKLSPWIGSVDQRTAELFFYVCGKLSQAVPDVREFLNRLGCRMKNIGYRR